MEIFVTGQQYKFPSANTYGFPSRWFYIALTTLGLSWTNNSGANFMISINHNSSSYKRFMTHGHRPDRCILIRTEPESVFPAQYSPRVEAKYGLILSPGRIAESPITQQFYEFQELHGGPGFSEMVTRELVAQSIRSGYFDFIKWNNRKIPVAMIGSNKFSPLKTNGYSLRREVVRNVPSGNITIFGKYWSDNLPQRLILFIRMAVFNIRNRTLPFLDLTQLRSHNSINVLGEIGLKSKILPNIKFLLIIENSMNVFTEKLFDAMVMGAIPIYVGPNLDAFGIPRSTYISVTPDINEICKVINQLNSIDQKTYLTEIRHFIASNYFFNTFSDMAPYKEMTNQIQKYINSVEISQ